MTGGCSGQLRVWAALRPTYRLGKLHLLAVAGPASFLMHAMLSESGHCVAIRSGRVLAEHGACSTGQGSNVLGATLENHIGMRVTCYLPAMHKHRQSKVLP